MLYDRYDAGKFFLGESNFTISFATLVPMPENIGRLKMTKIINSKVFDVPLELTDSESKASEVKYWQDRGVPINAESLTM